MAIDKTVLHSYRFGIGFLKQLCQGIGDDQLTHQPKPGMNHPVWIVGHLVDTMGSVAQMAGASYKAPDGYAELFGIKSKPVGDATVYPALPELLAELDKAVAAVEPGLNNVGAEALAAQTPDEGFRQMMPTVGDGLTFLLTGHIWMHVGQLSAWRRACGMPALF